MAANEYAALGHRRREKRVLLTVATTVMNARDALARTIDSITTLKQDWIRYIVVDGASTDGTRELAAGSSVVDLLISERDGGIYDAMNKAVAATQPGSYLLFLGAGDLLRKLPEADHLAAEAELGTKLVFGNVTTGDRLFRSRYDATLLYRNSLHHQGLLTLKRTEDDTAWFDSRCRAYADWAFNLRCFLANEPATSVDLTVADAEPAGVSGRLHLRETYAVVRQQAGVARALASVSYHLLAKGLQVGRLLPRVR